MILFLVSNQKLFISDTVSIHRGIKFYVPMYQENIHNMLNISVFCIQNCFSSIAYLTISALISFQTLLSKYCFSYIQYKIYFSFNHSSNYILALSIFILHCNKWSCIQGMWFNMLNLSFSIWHFLDKTL